MATSSASGVARERIPAGVWMLGGVSLSVALGFGVVAPAIPLFAREYGVGKTAIGLAISAFAFFRFVSALGAGSLVERFGERRMLVLGLLTVAVSSVAAALAPAYPLFVALRGVGGIGSAAFTVSAISLVLRLSPPTMRGRCTNIFQSGFLLGGVVGPGIGGPLTDVDPRMPFFFYGGTLLLAAAVAGFGLRGRDGRRDPAELVAEAAAEQDGEGAGPALTVRAALRHPAYVSALLVSFGTGWTLMGVRNSLFPLYVVEDLARSATFAGIGILVGAAAQAVGLIRAGWFVDAVGRRPATILGSTAATVAILIIVAFPSATGFLAGMVGLGLGAALLGSGPSAIVGDVSAGRAGKTVAVFQMASDIGAMSGPIVAGALADRWGTGPAFYVTAAVLAVGLLAAVRMPETRPGTR